MGSVVGVRRRGARPRTWDVHRSGQGARHRAQGPVFLGALPVPVRAVAATHSGAVPGRRFAARRQVRGRQGRSGGHLGSHGAAAAELGRDPRSTKIFTMVTPILAETHEQAVAKLAEYRQFVSTTGALALFGGWTGVDLAELGADDPLRYSETDANRSALASFTTDERTWTARELAEEIGIGGRGPVLVGSPTEVADELERGS